MPAAPGTPPAPPWWQRFPAAVALSALLIVLIAGSASDIGTDPGMILIDKRGIALGVAASLGLLLAWIHPWLALLAVAGLLAAYWGLGYAGGPIMVAGPLAVLRLGLLRPRRELYAAAAVLLVIVLVTLWVAPRPAQLSEVSALVGFVIAMVFAAEALRQWWSRRQAELEVRRRQQAQGLAENQLELARELHDGVAHSLTAIAVQASLIERLAERDPAAAREAAAAIATSSRTALADLNDIVRSLRRPGDAPTTPARTLDEIDSLVAQSEASGHRVRYRRARGGPQPSAEREQAAYRVVQEALTNATRYAPGSEILVQVRTEPGLSVLVRDNGPDSVVSASPGAGHGLVGMAERVKATGGELRYGPIDPSGFEVEARWP